MDISLDQTLESSSEKHSDNLDEETANDLMRDGQSSLTTDGQQSGLYQFRPNDNGELTYRVVHVGGPENNQQATLSIVSSNNIQNLLSPGGTSNSGSQVAIVANPFNESGNGNSNTTSENQGSKFAYFSSGSASSSAQDISSQSDQSVAQGQFYVMMSPQDMLQSVQSSNKLAPKNQFTVPKLDAIRGPAVIRDATRRVQHNEVERRRRDKINNWIMRLSKIVPDCAGDHSKQGQSKGGILAKTCDYILDLQVQNRQYLDSIKEMERLQEELAKANRQIEEKKRENAILHQALNSHGISVDIKNTRNIAQ